MTRLVTMMKRSSAWMLTQRSRPLARSYPPSYVMTGRRLESACSCLTSKYQLSFSLLPNSYRTEGAFRSARLLTVATLNTVRVSLVFASLLSTGQMIN